MRMQVAHARRNLKLPDWYPLDMYSRELSDDEWATDMFICIGFADAYVRQAEPPTGAETGVVR